MHHPLLNQPYLLTAEQIEFYQTFNYIKLKHVLDAETLNYFNSVITSLVEENKNQRIDLDKRDTYGKAFLQEFNLWKRDQQVAELIFSKRLAQIATELMKCKGVRLYHDQALFKEAGGGITPWHADQHYWPFSNNNAITAWIPLQPVSLEMGPLEFSAGSHVILEGREMEISDDSEQKIAKNLKVNDFKQVNEPFDLGEVSFHSGWIFHRAGANQSSEIRKVMTIIYMDSEMHANQPKNDSQWNDLRTWCPAVEPGNLINSELNPVLYFV